MNNKTMKKAITIALSAALAVSGLVSSPESEAAAKLSITGKVTVTVGKAKKLSITAKGYTVKKVTCISEAKNVSIKTSKKAVTITAKKGTAGQGDYLVTTIKAKKGKKTKNYKFYTSVTIQGASTTEYISTVDQLKKIDTKNSKAKYILKNDIDMSGWTKPFESMYCSIDGAGYTLKNLSVPLVGKLYGGTIENLTFDLAMGSVYEQWGDKYVAPICYIGPGNNNETATIRKCGSTGAINLTNTSGYDQSSDMNPIYVAGLVGTNPNNYGQIEYCYNLAYIKTAGYPKVAVGGIIGNVAGKTGVAVIRECKNSGGISVDNSGDAGMGCGVGGIAGYATSSAMTKDCLNTNNVNATNKDRSGGGLTGFGDQRLENCINLAAADYGVVGGKVDEYIIKSWNYSAQMFKNVYFSSLNEYGFNWEGSPVEVSGVKSVSDMTDQSVFVGFDFTKIWKMTPAGPDLINIPS